MPTIAPDITLPDGYELIDRLGSGGYGEVWRATAPGGVEKAVKIVFGHYEEDLAERELKSLTRIKDVRHPFLLSVERYEIVNNRLVIVTELADTSLDKCYQVYREQGLSGVPREELLVYLSDAAEGLDCLSQRHKLQHLDVKPENLLIIGEHVKVADFGLVKELATQTLRTMVGGMTPLYSAPEVYDDAPTDRSDQYSLAIVYQQMLTGALPFSGRTAAQLAKQHTLAVPNLGSLSKPDRVVIGRALDKDPANRYGSCKEFVAALAGQSSNAPPVAQAAVSNSTATQQFPLSAPPSNKDTKSAVAISTTPLAPKTANPNPTDESQAEPLPQSKAAAPVQHEFEPVKEVVNEIPPSAKTVSSCVRPTLFIAIGGVGAEMLSAVASRWESLAEEAPPAEWLLIDTERDTLSETLRDETNQLSPSNTLHIPLRRPKQYRDASRELLLWVSRRWLYSIPRSLQTRGYRPLGRIAAVDHAKAIVSQLRKKLEILLSKNSNDPSPALQVVLLAGTGGGTGGGIAIDVAQAARKIGAELGTTVPVAGIFGLTVQRHDSDTLAAANTVSLLTELAHAQEHGNTGEAPPFASAAYYESEQRAFDELYIKPLPVRSQATQKATFFSELADYLQIRTSTDFSSLTPRESSTESTLRTFGIGAPGRLMDLIKESQVEALRCALLGHWLSETEASLAECNQTVIKLFDEQRRTNLATEVSRHFFQPVPEEVLPEAEESPTVVKALTQRERTLIKQLKQWLEDCSTTSIIIQAEQQDLDTLIQPLGRQFIAEWFAQDANEEVSLSEHLEAVLDQHAAAHLAANQPEERVAALSLSTATTNVLECGHSRCSVLLKPADDSVNPVADQLTQPPHNVVAVESPLKHQLLVREAWGLKPADLAARLAESLPDVADAASRLQTRQDISWVDLRVVIEK